MKMASPKVRRRVIVGALGAGAAYAVGRPLLHLARTYTRDKGEPAKLGEREVDDASHLNSTRVQEIITLPASVDAAAGVVREVFARATRDKLHVAIAGARHTMGGHTQAPGGIVLDTSALAGVTFDEKTQLATVGGGARWRQIIDVLDKKGASVSIMQSNDDFSVGGSMSANCHGWQPNRPPIASSIESFRLLGPDGELRTCSREHDSELFALVLGGYGLFGVIVDVTLRTTKNVMYVSRHARGRADGYPALFKSTVREDTGIAYGRLSVAPEAFLTNALLNAYDIDPKHQGALPARKERDASLARRLVFRGEVDSDYGKSLRWGLESRFGSEGGDRATRNDLLSEPVALFANKRADYTDILHEYFVPATDFARFLAFARVVVPRWGVDLMNVTVRNVLEDRDAYLRYARENVFALVMLFAQTKTPAGEVAMGNCTRALVDAVLEVGGSYYLPYRGHPTRDQFRAAYPMADAFSEAKKRYDPKGVLTNRFYERYF